VAANGALVCSQLEARLAAASSAVAADPSASAVAVAVLMEFRRKFDKTRKLIEGPDGSARREAVVELEQAADSAKMAALADTGATPDTRRAIVSAHDTICWFKATGEVLDRDHIEPDPLAHS
jgi:hypothetical protein